MTNPIHSTSSSNPYFQPAATVAEAETSTSPIISQALPTTTASLQNGGMEKGQVCTFLKLAELIRENRYTWTLEEILTERLFAHIQETQNPTKEQVGALFSLVLILTSDSHDKDSFKKQLHTLCGKEKLPGALAALSILANCRSYFKTPLYALLGEKCPSPREQPEESTKLYFSFIPYLETLSHSVIGDLKKFVLDREEHVEEFRNHALEFLKSQAHERINQHATKINIHLQFDNAIKSVSFHIKSLETRFKKISHILGNITYDSNQSRSFLQHQITLYQRFLYRESDAILKSLDDLQKITEEILLTLDNSTLAVNADGSFALHLPGYRQPLMNLIIEIVKKRNTPGTKAYEEFQVASTSGKKEIPLNIFSEIRTLFIVADQLKALSTPVRMISDLKLAKEAAISMKTSVLSLRDTRQKLFSLAKDRLTTFTQPEEPSWLFIEDFIDDEPKTVIKREKRPKPLESSSDRINATEAFQLMLQSPTSEQFIQIIPAFAYLLSKDVKRCLQSKVEAKSYPIGIQVKAGIAKQELIDHIQYGALNFALFIKMMHEGDLYGLKVVLPLLFLDLHVQVEQWIKHDIILKTGSYPATHSLLKMAQEANFDNSPIFSDFNYALQQVRYPLASKDIYPTPPKALHWILYSLQIADNDGIIDSERVLELKELVSFVFDSYKEVARILSQPTQITTYLDDCKIELLERLDSHRGKTFKECRKRVPSQEPIQACLTKAKQLQGATTKTTRQVQQCLDEAAIHLEQIAAGHYLKTHFSHKIFTPIHKRNQLLYQWVFEQLFVAQGIAKGIGDLRWIRHHDLSSYYYILHAEDFAPHDKRLDPFNFGRTLHYGREKGDDSPEYIKDTLATLKTSRKVAKQQLTGRITAASKPVITDKIDDKAQNLLQSLVNETFDLLMQ
jgi:hypothetical protein